MSSGAHVDARTPPPVLFLTGIGLSAAVALRSIAMLEMHFRVLAAQPETGQEAVALLDDAGVEQAHVVGLSFGGVPAQELATGQPERVRSLVLASSSAGGERYAAPAPAVRQFVRGLAGLPIEEGLWAAVPYLYAATTCRDHAARIGEDLARRLSTPLDPRRYRRQLAIARAHDSGARLARITAPTLVVHGEQDRIVPVDNGRLLADGIPGARFVAVAGGGHAFPTDVPGASGELVSFLLAHSPRRAGPGGAASSAGRAASRSARADRA